MPTCSNCGGSFDDTFQFCPYCGRETQKPQDPVVDDVVTQKSQSPMNCPKCHRVDAVSKVSAIVQGGTHQIDGQIPTTTYDSDGWPITSYKSYHATHQSNLAKTLAWPEKPAGYFSQFCGCFPIFGFLGLLLLGGLSNLFGYGGVRHTTQETLSMLLIVVIVLGLIVAVAVFAFWVDKSQKVKHDKKMVVWQNAMIRWDKLYYCSRDDCMFILGEKSTFATSAINDVIDWHPPTGWRSLFKM